MLNKLDEFRYVIPRSYKTGMRIEGLIYASSDLIHQIQHDQTMDQVANVATLPGLVGRSLAMPDAHQGYGFCIGGVAAADMKEGIVSAGGVGFDINCGVRLLASSLYAGEVRPRLSDLLNQLFRDIPCGTGRSGLLDVSRGDLDRLLQEGAPWTVEQGYGRDADLGRIEDYGRILGSDPAKVSKRAKERGHDQVGTLGSGNHFLEIQEVTEIFDSEVASSFGLHEGQVVLLVHSGSRGLGHQVCSDYLDLMQEAMKA